MNEQLEHPDISQTLRTGYLKREIPYRHDDVHEVRDDEYIEILYRSDAEK